MADDVPSATASLRTDECATGSSCLWTVGADGGYGDASAHTLRQAARDVTEVIPGLCVQYVSEERPIELARAILGVVGP